MAMAADPVGVGEIAERLAGSRKTVWKWVYQGIFPDPEYPSINGYPAWEWLTVLRWAGDSQRIHDSRARAEYKRRFGQEPPKYRPAGPLTEQVAKVNARTLAAKAKPRRTTVTKGASKPKRAAKITA